MRKSFFTTLLVLTCSGKMSAQVAKDDFAHINKAYAEHPNLSVKMKYEAYKNKNATLALSTEMGELKRKDTDKYTRIGKIETVETETYKLIVDHEDKNISMLGIRKDESEKQESADMYPVNLEKIIAICSKVEFKKINSNQNSYTLVIPGQEYDELKFIYNAKTFFIEKIILYYAEKQNLEEQEGGLKEAPRMEITYSDFNTKPDYEKTPFSYDAFLEKRNGKLVAKPAYKTYTVNEQSF